MDLSGALLGITILSPGFFLIGLGIKLTSSGPIFFRQERVGLHGQTFQILKFRTMTNGDHSSGSQVTSQNDQRITSIGHFLRRHKLDEYPQLFNVLQGQMSLVGPRPEVPRYVKIYPREFDRVFLNKPGMTHRVSLMLRHEEEILANSSDPEAMYIQSVLPWKLSLYLGESSPDSAMADIATICRTVFDRRIEVARMIPQFDTPMVGNIPAYPDSIGERTPVMANEISTGKVSGLARTGTAQS